MPRLFKKSRKHGSRNPNLEDAINNLIIPPLSHLSQLNNYGCPAIAQDQMQVDVVMARPSTSTPPDLDPAMSTSHDQMQVDVYGAGSSSSAPGNFVASSSEQMTHDTAQVHAQDQTDHYQRLLHVCLIPSSTSVGQDQTFQKVCKFLKDDNIGIVGIYGMDGVGKTTLLERVHSEFLVRCSFDVIIWIVVTKKKNEARIQKKIMSKLGLTYDKDDTTHERAIKIHNKLCRMSFVLLIDNMWEHLDMKKLGIPNPNQVKKSKIIFTTRLEEVCDQMHSHQKVKVDCLGWNDAWTLFEQTVGERTLDSHPKIRDVAKKVAEECDRLPLALKVIGRAMASKRTPQKWENALTTLLKLPSEIPGIEEKLFSSLKLSFDALPNAKIKECFMYCCLFPEDWSVHTEQLVDYWIGEGFLGIDENLMEARNRGHEFISILKAACLLENRREGEVEVKMHDVIRDMALWIVSEHGKKKIKFFVHPSFRLSKSQTADRWKEAHRIFVQSLEKLPEKPACSMLSTLIVNSNLTSRRLTIDGLFNFMPCLRVLHLSLANHELELPTAIEQLVELRYLCLSGVGPRRQPLLSWLGKLTKLKVLDLSSIAIGELPNTIGQLVELKHLNLTGCKYLKVLPEELGNCCQLEMLNLRGNRHLKKLPTTIGKLAELRYLNLILTSIKMLPEGFWELKNLEHLYFLGDRNMRFTAVELWKLVDLQSLSHLEICVSEISSLGRLSNCLTRLWTSHCPDTTRSMKLLPLFGCMDRLSELWIENSPVETIVTDAVSNINAQNTSFCSLEQLTVQECADLSAIILDELSLVNLRKLWIFKCDRLKHITGLRHLQQLEKLYVISGGCIEEVISTNEWTGGNICFPRLKSLWIDSLHELKSICGDTVSFPSLERFYLEKCPRLEKFPLGLINGNRTLRICTIRGSYEWWNGLKWQDDNFKSFLPYLWV